MKRHASLVPVALLALSSYASAADTPPDSGTAGSLVQAVLGLGIVLALIWGAAWLLRRLQPTIARQQGALKVVGSQSVGQRERIVVIEIAEQWLVVGVAPGSVNALTTLPKGTLPEPAAPSATFATLLARARGARRTQ